MQLFKPSHYSACMPEGRKYRDTRSWRKAASAITSSIDMTPGMLNGRETVSANSDSIVKRKRSCGSGGRTMSGIACIAWLVYTYGFQQIRRVFTSLVEKQADVRWWMF